MADAVTKGMRTLFRQHKSASDAALNWDLVHGCAGKTAEVSADAALKISAFYRAIDLRTDSVGKYPMYVIDTNTRRHVEDHYLGKVLWERPNEAMTPYGFKKLVEYQRLVLGNAYVWLYRDGNGRTIERLPLPPGSCKPWIEPGTGKLSYLAADPKTGDVYCLDGEDIEHYKGFSTNGVEGIGLLRHAAQTLAVAASRDDYERAVYDNGGNPAGILYTDGDLSRLPELTLPDGSKASYKDVIRREWDKIHRGPGNAFRIAVMDNGLKFQPLAMSHADAQFVENKAVTVEDLARFVGVPLHKLYAGKQSYSSNEANSLDYVTDSMHPTVVQYEQEGSYKLLTASERRSGLWLQMNMMAELRADSQTRAEWYRVMREIGAYSVNDILAKEDEPDVEGGNIRLISRNFDALERFGKGDGNK